METKTNEIKTKSLKMMTCAFCNGTGRDPFGIVSKLSYCQVCGGKGEVYIREPAITCAFCQGTGIHPRNRLNCIACKGKGLISLRSKDNEQCPWCCGTGHSKMWREPCSLCKGAGVIPSDTPDLLKRKEFKKAA